MNTTGTVGSGGACLGPARKSAAAEPTAQYLDGRRSLAQPMIVRVNSGDVLLGVGKEVRIRGSDVRVSAALGRRAPVSLHLPDGAVVETADPQLRARLEGLSARRRPELVLCRWEAGPLAWVAFPLAIALLGWFVFVAFPALAERMVGWLPEAFVAEIARESLEVVDRPPLLQSALSERRQAEITQRVRAVEEVTGTRVQLLFRSHPEPNAIALAGGNLIVIDSLVELAQTDDELIAVLLHEIGHVHHLHPLKRLLGSFGAAGFVLAYASDIEQLNFWSEATLGTLVENAYRRDMEREADEYALQALSLLGIPPSSFEQMLRRLEPQLGSRGSDFLSTHPVMKQRIESARHGG